MTTSSTTTIMPTTITTIVTLGIICIPTLADIIMITANYYFVSTKYKLLSIIY